MSVRAGWGSRPWKTWSAELGCFEERPRHDSGRPTVLRSDASRLDRNGDNWLRLSTSRSADVIHQQEP